MPLLKLRVSAATLEAGRRAEMLLAELLTPEPLAVTLFADPTCAFAVEAYYADAPPLDRIARALAQLCAGLGPPALQEVPDSNWVALSQAALAPVRAGRFLVHGRHDRRRIPFVRTAVEIEAGEAFGTAHNATTVLCLESIDYLARTRRFRRVLDLGCGTGILGIALARAQPTARVIASDSDPIATAIARANARLNGVAPRMRIITATSFDHAALRAPEAFDLLLANLLPRPLIALAVTMRQRLAPGGVAVLSGMLMAQARQVCAACCGAGLRLARQRSRDGWTSLELTAP
jgi:ribosomal protein L11 methyltransferase